MRNSFINKLTEIAANNENIWLLTGDLGYSVLDKFGELFPSRYINAGVAEQNMTGMAAGLALEGAKAFTYSIANFPTFRCLEQIRNDVCYHDLDVKIISVGAGLSYGTHGYSHYGIEDIAIMRPLPNLTVLCPADPHEAVRCAQLAVDHSGPMYVRLGKNGEPHLHASPCSFNIGDPLAVIPTEDAAVISTGAISYAGFEAVQSLRNSGRQVGLITLPTLRPLNSNKLLEILGGCRRIFTLEEHVKAGGLFSILSELNQEEDLGLKISPFCLPEKFTVLGNQSFLLKAVGLDAQSIYTAISEQLERDCQAK